MKSLHEKEQYTKKQMDLRRDVIPLGRGPGCQSDINNVWSLT